MSAIGEAPARCPADCGFTLIEMLVTLGILALISGIAFPALDRAMARTRDQAGLGMVLLALAEARGDAIAGDMPVRLTLAPDRRRLEFSSRRAGLDLPDGASVEWPAQGLRFLPDGTAEAGAIALDFAPLPERRIRIDPQTGRAGQAP